MKNIKKSILEIDWHVLKSVKQESAEVVPNLLLNLLSQEHVNDNDFNESQLESYIVHNGQILSEVSLYIISILLEMLKEPISLID
ncbi:MAG TPA: hypothetical protein VLL52_09440 [Anaerolineae bacterium]|nr:hypothetical protein [Anaerolineae bacterium]